VPGRSVSIAVNKAHYPVTVLGPGRRIGIWLQGCSIRCPGCVSQDTWARDRGRDMDVEALLAWCRRTAGDQFDGVTISGGEPFDQPQALGALLKGLQRWRKASCREFDVLCYSGYPLATLQRKHGAILPLLDALIAEPYVDGLPLAHVWRGSANQPLVPMSKLGEARYAPYLDMPAAAAKRMQVAADGDRLWFIGIPHRGDMATLEALCKSRGLNMNDVSWR
jgi:anaerobic ribonucleoside-triphosphate reductase activating protein